MKKLRVTTELDCDVETFWKVFLSEDYNKKLFYDIFGFTEMVIVSQTDTTRRIRVIPKLNMPKPVMKLLGDSFGYQEEGRLDRDKNEWHWKMLPNTMGDKLKTEGVVRIVADGDKCRRTDEATLEAKVFGLGGLIESSTEKEIRDAWDKELAFLKRYLKEQA